MGFVEAVTLFFKNYANFNGRSRRAEYWWPQLFFMLVAIAFNVVVGVFVAMGDVGAIIAMIVSLAYAVFALGIIIPGLAVAVRRLHDREMSGWWLLIGLIPLIGGIVLLVFFCLEGTEGPNKFGDDPKNPGSEVIENF